MFFIYCWLFVFVRGQNNLKIMIKLKCEKCGIEYEKPADFKKWNDERPNVFFKWSLAFCDTCRRKKESEALKRLPEVIKALTNES